MSLKIISKNILAVSLAVFICSLFSCKKEGDNNNPANQKPRVGSKWVYRYSTFHAYGGLDTSYNVTFRASAMETLGGEQWLKIVDSATGTSVFYLKEKADGLYQYINNNSYMLCKYPAAVNDTYEGYNGTEATDYFVRSVGEVQSFGVLSNITVNYYEGMVGSQTADKLWYNTRIWLAQRYIYSKPVLGNNYYRSASLIIQDFIY